MLKWLILIVIVYYNGEIGIKHIDICSYITAFSYLFYYTF
nr:MAG TPA: hypothetical protein [Caudoviricetes sp.]